MHASLRGTGCSGGEFDLFSTQSADDGKYVIDEWIAKQPWSDGDMAILGHSYSGITGFLVASRQPRHLRAMTVSGLIDDVYRGIVYPEVWGDRKAWIDELVYRSAPLDRVLAIAGPITATLFVQSSATDTDLFVQLVDEAPDGSRSYLQRGLLRASHRAVDASRSDSFAGRIYRPWRPHVNPTSITPGETYEYLVEIFPVGHVFRPGHRIVVKIHTPPIVDSIYAYVPKRLPGVNTVLRDSVHASRVTLPIVPTPWSLGAELPCGAQEAVRCLRG